MSKYFVTTDPTNLHLVADDGLESLLAGVVERHVDHAAVAVAVALRVAPLYAKKEPSGVRAESRVAAVNFLA